jgi:hypothetical protein
MGLGILMTFNPGHRFNADYSKMKNPMLVKDALLLKSPLIVKVLLKVTFIFLNLKLVSCK